MNGCVLNDRSGVKKYSIQQVSYVYISLKDGIFRNLALCSLDVTMRLRDKGLGLMNQCT